MEEKVDGPPKGTNSNDLSPINDTLINRILVLAAVKLAKHLHRHHAGNVLFVSAKICIKACSGAHLSEASTIRFIAQSTSILV
jgi:hypothetical protein